MRRRGRRRAGPLDGAGHVQLLGGAGSRARARAVSQRPHRRGRRRAPGAVRRPRNAPDAEPRPGDPGARAMRAGARALAASRSARTSTAANLDSPELFPVFEAAASLGAAVFVHPWEMVGEGSDDASYWLPWLVGMPAEDVARDLLAHLRRRAREVAGSADRLRPRRRRLSRRRSGASSTASTRGPTCAPFPTTSLRANTYVGSTSTRSFTSPSCCATSST